MIKRDKKNLRKNENLSGRSCDRLTEVIERNLYF